MTVGSSVGQLRGQLAASRQGLLLAISGVSEQQFKRRPMSTPEDEQPWCIAEVLTHLLIDERLWTGRIELALQQPGAEVQPSDPDELAAGVRAGRIAPVPQIIHGLLAARRDLERLLDDAGARTGALELSLRHLARGSLSVEWMARKVIEHEREHVAQIEALREAVGADAARA